MSDEKLTMIFDACRRGEGPAGWGAARHSDIDSLVCQPAHEIWVRHNEPVGPWTVIPVGVPGTQY